MSDAAVASFLARVDHEIVVWDGPGGTGADV
jgi:hypothetical protein